MSGIFSSLYDLRLKSHHNPLEDYLTEIFKYCLESNVELLQKFLIHFGIYEAPFETYSFTTQFKLKALDNHTQGSRPDMALFLNDATIYFENKINSGEGEEQLKRYAEHLGIGYDNPGTLVYITKDYDPSKWATIYCRQSLQGFLSEANQISKVQDFYMGSLKTLEQIFADYPQLPVIRDENIIVSDDLN